MSNVHAVLADHTQFLKMTEKISPLIKKTDNFYFPVGKVIDLIFEETKPIDYEHIIKPQEIDHKGRKLWNICQTCKL